jgi:ketol-acid reductoisomerase
VALKLYFDDSASLDALGGQTLAVVGYGNQGRAQALNLRDSGMAVIVGNRDDEYRGEAVRDGFDVVTIAEAARRGDIVLVLTTDESQPLIWADQIAPGLEAGNMLVWASGYNVGYGLITPPADVDVVLVAPRMPGSEVRTMFERGVGALSSVWVHQDSTGTARERMMALAKGIGSTRVGVFETSFREEAELDLFAEQILWPGLSAWFEACFELMVEAGFSPELVVMELYASGEVGEVFRLISEEGFYRQMVHHSTTARYGDLSRAPLMRSEELKERAKKLLVEDIKGGAFAAEWTEEQRTGGTRLAELWEQALSSPMARAEAEVLPLVRRQFDALAAEAARTSGGSTT